MSWVAKPAEAAQPQPNTMVAETAVNPVRSRPPVPDSRNGLESKLLQICLPRQHYPVQHRSVTHSSCRMLQAVTPMTEV